MSLVLFLLDSTHWLRWGTSLRQIFSWGPGSFWSGENTSDKLFFPEIYEMNVLAPRAFGSKKKTYPEGREHFGKQKVIANGGTLGTHVGFNRGCLV